MRSPLGLAVIVGALACGALTACGGRAAPAEPVGPAAYLQAVEELIAPPARLSGAIAEADDGTATEPRPERLDDLVDTAEERLETFRVLNVTDPALRRQRDRLAAAYARLVPRMRAAAEALAGRDPATIREAAVPFLDALEGLPG